MLYGTVQELPRSPRLTGRFGVVSATILACLLLAGRIAHLDNLGYIHMIWNLFLAWIPYHASLVAAQWRRRYPRQPWLIAMPAAIWLLFLPNAPYLGTDFVHLLRIPSPALWYDIGLLLAFTWAGFSLAVASLSTMHTLVEDWLGRTAGWFMVLATVELSGLGVYLGRFRRWNSWDLLVHPHDVLADAAARLAHPLSQPQAYEVTLVFSALLLVSYLTIAWERR
jgi:uncharacterized membrane protein